MSAFFESEIIKNALDDINKVLEDVYGILVHFHMMTYDEQLDHVSKLTELLDKQRIMYTRLSLSDDPEAVIMKESLNKTVTMMGYPEGTDIAVLFKNMHATIDALKEFLEA